MSIRSHEERPTPYAELDLRVVRSQLDLIRAAIPDAEVFYAVKSNGHPQVIEELWRQRTKFEVASWGECERLLKLGVDPSAIIFSNPVKPAKHVAEAFDAGISMFAFDSHREIEKLACFAPGSAAYLRVAVSDHGSAFPLSSKFGCHPDDALSLAERARRKGLRFFGLTFHVGSQCESIPTWEVAIGQCGEVMRELAAVGIEIEVLNLGGGFPVTYVNRVPAIETIGQVIESAVDSALPYRPRLWVEPGRFLSAPAGSITTEIIGRETRRDREWLYVDMGVFQGLMECLEIQGWRYPVIANEESGGEAMRVFTLTGPSCDACDTLFPEIELPASLEPGARLRLLKTGAYALEYGSSFNGFSPPDVYVYGGSTTGTGG